MLASVSSRELTQWMAYEKIAGPIGPIYERFALQQIATLLNGEENAKPFMSPVQVSNYRPVEVSTEDSVSALNKMIPEG